MHGLRNFLDDLWNNGGMPQTVDKRPFEVGRNLAIDARRGGLSGRIFRS